MKITENKLRRLIREKIRQELSENRMRQTRLMNQYDKIADKAVDDIEAGNLDPALDHVYVLSSVIDMLVFDFEDRFPEHRSEWRFILDQAANIRASVNTIRDA